jgi:DNA (cytosine-5)-methyltransferase 1
MDRDAAKARAKETGIRCKRPLERQTMRRLAHGLVRFVIESAKPYIVTCNHGGPDFRGQSVDEPMSTLTASRDARGVVTPFVAGVGGRMGQSPPTSPSAPLGTVTAKNDRALITPYLVKYYGTAIGSDAGDPLHTVTNRDRCAVTMPYLIRANHGGDHFRGQDADRPMPTLTGSKTAAVVQPTLAPFLSSRYGEGPHQKTRGQRADEPLGTITPANNTGNAIAAFLARIGQQGSNGLNANDARGPLTTVTSKAEHLAVTADLAKVVGKTGARKESNSYEAARIAFVTQFFSGDLASKNKSPADPLPTITAQDHNGVAAVSVVKFRGESAGSSAAEPMPTVTGGAGSSRPAGAAHALGAVSSYMIKMKGSHGVGTDLADPLHTIHAGGRSYGPVAAYIVRMNHGEKQWNGAHEPLPTITSANHAAAVEAHLAKLIGPAVWAAFNHVYAFLLEYVGPDAPLPIVLIKGELYLIVDIGMRMLVPRELARAQGFGEDYVLTGTASQQVARIGNSVSPAVAEAVVRANCWDGEPTIKLPRHGRRRAA